MENLKENQHKKKSNVSTSSKGKQGGKLNIPAAKKDTSNVGKGPSGENL